MTDTEAGDYLTRIQEIVTGRVFPSVDELLRLLPFFKDSLEHDMIGFGGRILKRIKDEGGDTLGDLGQAAMRLREAAHSDEATPKDLADCVRVLRLCLPEDDKDDQLRCQIYRAALGVRAAQSVVAAEAAAALLAATRGKLMTDPDAEAHHVRVSEILTGDTLPSAYGLLNLLPFYQGDIRQDMVAYCEWAISDIDSGSDIDDPSGRIRAAAARLRQDAADTSVRDDELSRAVHALMLALPEDYRGRCLCYLAALGERSAQTALATSAAADILTLASNTSSASPWDRLLAQAALGWLTVLAAGSVSDPLTGAGRPERLRTPVDTALVHGRRIVEWLAGTGARVAAADGIKRDLLRRAGGYLELDLAADWLRIDVERLRRHAEAGDIIGVDIDGRTVVPAFQIKDDMTIIIVREILSVMPIKAGWMRLEWLLTPDDALGGLTPLEALRAGREAEVRELARSHGAD